MVREVLMPKFDHHVSHCWNVHISCMNILQEWCKFDLEWALFKERFEVAENSLSDSKPQGSVFWRGVDDLEQGKLG